MTLSILTAKTLVSQAVEKKQLLPNSGTNITKWLDSLAYAEYHAGILERVEAGDWKSLDQFFWEEIPFGTGGRRGPMSDFGSATINSRTIAESAWGLARYTISVKPDGPWSAAVACDSRNRSSEFARLTAVVLASQGFTVHLYDQPRSTPQLSFTVRHLHCDCGVVVSASHNPPSDNGFKAYWSHGGQVLPPHDKGIIQQVQQAAEIPRDSYESLVQAGRIRLIGPEIDAAYIQSVAKLSLSSARNVQALFTPLHGVGESSVYRILHQAGFANVGIFEPQRSPDGNFPNVPDHLPNPERPEVFAPAIELAKKQGHAVILASDPDADRLALVVRNRVGGYECLTGNQTGALVVDYILRKRKAMGKLSAENYVVETLVTTPMIGTIARSFGVRVFDQLLVGFKYIAAIIEQHGSGGFLFGAEESLGYLSGETCRDKDAAVAALYALELAAELQANGKTLLDRLDELSTEFGVHREEQVSRTIPGPQGQAMIGKLMSTFRSQPPASFGPVQLEQVRDYLKHEIRDLPQNAVTAALPEPSGELMIVSAKADRCRLQIALRPSGTEPKIKFYLFAQVDRGVPLAEAKTLAKEVLASLKTGLTAWIDSVVN